MHELSLAIEILRAALEHGEANKALRINDIQLEAVSPGAVSHINPENLQSYFDLVSRGTIAEGAELSIDFNQDEAGNITSDDLANSFLAEEESLEVIDNETLILKSLRIEKQ